MSIDYRDEAIKKLHEVRVSAPLAIIRPQAWLLLAAMLAATLISLIWAFTYQLPEFSKAQGIFLVPGSVRGVASVTEGRIVEVKVQSGQSVKKGQVIARIQTPKLDIAVAKAKAEYNAVVASNKVLKSVSDKWYAIDLKGEEDKKNESASIAGQGSGISNQLKKMIDKQAEMSRKMMSSMESKNKIWQLVDGDGSGEGALFPPREMADRNRTIVQDTQSKMDIEVRTAQMMLTGEMEEKKKLFELQSLQEQKEQDSQLLCSHDGTILSLNKVAGDAVRAGDRVVTLVDASADPTAIQCLSFFEIGAGNRVAVGDTALVTPSTHKRERHGSIRGKVAEVQPYLVTEESLFAQIGSKVMTEAFLKKGNLKGIQIVLETGEPAGSSFEADNVDYEWTGKCPDDFDRLQPGTTASVRIQTNSFTPAGYAFATLRKWLGDSDK